MLEGLAQFRLPGAQPPDGAGPIGPDQPWPEPLDIPFEKVLAGLNPLHHLPGVGMIYRAATGETIPTPMRILGAGIVGGPVGVAGAIIMSFIEELFQMGPDLSRPSTPEGMSLSAEAGMTPVTPGDPVQEGSYLTLATTNPDFLGGPTEDQRGRIAYAAAAQGWQMSHGGGSGMA